MKKTKKLVLLILATLAILAALVALAYYFITANLGKPEGLYTPEKLADIIDDFEKYSSREFKIGDEKCLNYWYAGKRTEDDLYYDECNYYIFKDNDSAQKAFEYMRENWIEKKTDSGKKYIQGWEAGVCDASVEIYIYITENMIITTEVQVVSAWSVDSSDYAPPANHTERVDFIKKNF